MRGTGDPRRLAWAIAPGAMLAGVGGGLAFPILPTVGQRVGLSLGYIGVILAANRAARILASPVVGVVADRFGGRRTFLAGLGLQLVTMLLYWLGVRTSHAGPLFLAGRIVHGPGSACVVVAGQALALHAGGREGSGQTSGIVRGAMGVGVPVGLVLGGVLADTWGEARTFEVAGAAIAAAAIGAFVLVPDLRVPIRKAATLADVLRALSDRRIAAIGGLNFVASFVGSGLVLTTTVLVVEARQIELWSLPERTTASVFMGWLVVVEAISMPAFGRAGDRFKAHAWIATAGVAAIAPALVVIARAGSAVTYALGLALLAAGVGALGPSVLGLLAERAPPELRGVAVGALQVTADVGGAAGPLVGTAFFAGSVEAPYLFGALVVTLFLPPAIWLARSSRQA